MQHPERHRNRPASVTRDDRAGQIKGRKLERPGVAGRSCACTYNGCRPISRAASGCCSTTTSSDLIPSFGTEASMISPKERGKNVEQQAHRSADDCSPEAVGGRAEGGGCGAGSWSVQAHDLCLESEVRWDGCEPGAGGQAVAG